MYFLFEGRGRWAGGGALYRLYSCLWAAWNALWAFVAGCEDLPARGIAHRPAGAVLPMGQGRSVAPRRALWVTAARTTVDAADARSQGILPLTP